MPIISLEEYDSVLDANIVNNLAAKLQSIGMDDDAKMLQQLGDCYRITNSANQNLAHRLYLLQGNYLLLRSKFVCSMVGTILLFAITIALVVLD